MRTKLLFSFLLAFYFLLSPCTAQVPQGFNYQAIARDISGNPIPNQSLPVRITIQSDSLGGTTFWIEEHSSVTTNGFGLFTLILGHGIRQTASTVASFNNIDWSVTPKFIKTEINYNGWKAMGSTRLWSVPYSMEAGSLSGAVKKLAVAGETSDMEEALFEVKNKNGQTVFAVYNDGVRVYVNNGTVKGATKGGFAIGGFGTAKAPGQEYFRVTSDSTRIYVDDGISKGATKGGFAIGGFSSAKAPVQEYLRITRDSTRIFINNTVAKSTKGGFAIGGFNQAKGGVQDFLTISYDSIRMYINDNPVKSTKGGFAIGGFGIAKGPKRDYMTISPDSTNFYVRSLSPLVSSSFNIVGVNPSFTHKSLLKANTDTVAVSQVLTLQKNLIVTGNLDVGGAFKQAPLVMTTAPSSITQNTASGGGNIVSNSGAAVIQSGVCWSTSANPTILLATKTTDGLALGPYNSAITGLTASTLYYVRAYATNSIGTSYGNEISFTTIPVAPPSLTTTSLSSIAQTTAASGGNITSDGGVSVTARGVCWNTSTNPTTSNSKTTDGTGIGVFTSSITGMTVSTTYYLRAYATNSVGTAYGDEVSFTTLAIGPPTLSTVTVASITQTTASSGGDITNDGGASVTVRGVCWNTSTNPTTANTKTTDGPGTGVFTSSITGLTASTTYYLRAYATNSAGTSYGNQLNYTTTAPTVPDAPIIGTATAGNGQATVTFTAPVNNGGSAILGYTVTSIPGFSVHPGSASPVTVTGLINGTSYTFFVTATNAVGTSSASSLSNSVTPVIPTVTDFDGNIYNTVTIGTQIWMTENLKTTRYNDGTTIPNITDGTAWAALTTGAYSDYSNTPANSTTYGRMYNWYSVDNNAATKVASNGGKNVCPTSWHVPSDAEWHTLILYLDGSAILSQGTESTLVGGKLKETGTTHWITPNTGATNETGFSSLPGGLRLAGGTFGNVGYYGCWWSSTENSTTTAWSRYTHYNDTYVYRSGDGKQGGYSVRCVKD